MTPLCWLLIGCAFLAGIGSTVVLWAASGISGAHAEEETPIEE
jgi:hypothetical protein